MRTVHHVLIPAKRPPGGCYLAPDTRAHIEARAGIMADLAVVVLRHVRNDLVRVHLAHGILDLHLEYCRRGEESPRDQRQRRCEARTRRLGCKEIAKESRTFAWNHTRFKQAWSKVKHPPSRSRIIAFLPGSVMWRTEAVPERVTPGRATASMLLGAWITGLTNRGPSRARKGHPTSVTEERRPRAGLAGPEHLPPLPSPHPPTPPRIENPHHPTQQGSHTHQASISGGGLRASDDCSLALGDHCVSPSGQSRIALHQTRSKGTARADTHGLSSRLHARRSTGHAR